MSTSYCVIKLTTIYGWKHNFFNFIVTSRRNRTMFNLRGIVAAILKMATGRNFSMSGINSGHHYLPTYKILMISDNVEFLPPFVVKGVKVIC
jgi:hypothetical protein